ncbi:MAG: hypothetical protein JSW09_06800, partial [Pseudomonadota bacterium]
QDRFGDLERLGLEESELLFWLYNVVTTHRAGEGKASYALVLDEDMSADAMRTAKRIFAACGLEWTAQADAWLAERAPNWRASTTPWRELVPAELHGLIEGLVCDELAGWWSEDQAVSGINYTW